METTRYRWVSPILLLGSLAPSFVGAQQAGVTVGGEIGASVEVTNEGDRSRPATLARLSLRPSIAVDGLGTMTFDFLLSTGEEALRSSPSQAPDQYSVGLDWGWARADLGDVKRSYSPLTLGEVSVRGGGLSGRRGPVRFSAFGGRSVRSSSGREPPSPFDRNVQGGRVGVGDTTSLAFDVVMVRASDDVPWLPTAGDIAAPAPPADGVAPEANLVVGAVGSAALFGKALSFRGELMRSGSATEMAKSSVDYAHSLQATARLKHLTATGTYRDIGTGYESLDAESLSADRRELSLSAKLQFSGWNLTMDGLRHHDNLSGEKLFTTAQTRLRAKLAVRPLKSWNMSLQAKRSTKDNGAADPAHLVDQRGWTLATDQGLTVSQRGVLRSASVGYEVRLTSDAKPSAAVRRSEAHVLNVRALTSVTSQLQVTPSLRIEGSGFLTAPGDVRRVYAMQARHRTKGGTLRSALDVSWTKRPGATWWEMTLSSRVFLGSDAKSS